MCDVFVNRSCIGFGRVTGRNNTETSGVAGDGVSRKIVNSRTNRG